MDTEDLLRGRQFDFDGEVQTPLGTAKANCLTDMGALAKSFVDVGYARVYKLYTVPLAKPCKLKLADDKLVPNITHVVRLVLVLGEYVEELWCLVTALGKFDVILGMPWLEEHDPSSSFSKRSLTFDSDHCMLNCLLRYALTTIYSGPARPKLEALVGDIVEVSAYAFTRLLQREENQIMVLWLQDFERLKLMDKVESPPKFIVDVVAISPEDYDKFFKKAKRTPISRDELKRKVLEVYYKWLDVWDPVEANKLPLYRLTNYVVLIREGTSPPAKRAYGMSRE